MSASINAQAAAYRLQDELNRRLFLRRGSSALGMSALVSLLGQQSSQAETNSLGLPGFQIFQPKQSG